MFPVWSSELNWPGLPNVSKMLTLEPTPTWSPLRRTKGYWGLFASRVK